MQLLVRGCGNSSQQVVNRSCQMYHQAVKTMDVTGRHVLGGTVKATLHVDLIDDWRELTSCAQHL